MNGFDFSGFLKLRWVVGYLGEKDQYAWWPTAFLAPTARVFLEPAFPKSWRLAQYNGVTQAARRTHDEFIGVGRVYHLFRLPEEIEQDLHSLMLNGGFDERLPTLIVSRDSAFAELAALGKGPPGAGEGPVNVGEIRKAAGADGLRVVAQYYAHAFAHGRRVYPYFSTGK